MKLTDELREVSVNAELPFIQELERDYASEIMAALVNGDCPLPTALQVTMILGDLINRVEEYAEEKEGVPPRRMKLVDGKELH